MVNKVILIGNVGIDPEIRTTEGGVKVARIRLATTERLFDRQANEAKEHTEWHTITLWRGLADVVDKLLQNGAEDDVNAALDRLFETNPRAHDELADMVESRAETLRIDAQGQEFDIQLFAAPVLAWSRFSIPACALPQSTLQALAVQLGAHVFGGDTRLALADAAATRLIFKGLPVPPPPTDN